MARAFVLALATLTLGAPLSVMADEALSQAKTADVRCIIVGSVMVNQEANAHSAVLPTLYFLGRIDVRVKSERKRCGKELEGRGMATESINISFASDTHD
jgi:hypothetical protein